MDNWFRKLLSKITRKQLIIAGIILGVVLIAGIIAFMAIYNKRENLLASAIARMQSRLERDYQIDLAIDTAYFSGLSTVTFENISLTPQGHERLMEVKDMSV